MGATRITPEEIITMQRLYRQLGTNAAVAREIGRSESSVSKYMQMKGVPDNIRIAVENLSQKVGEYTMKKWIALLLAAVLCLSLVACGNKVEDIEVNGETVSVTDFLVEHLGTYMNSEGYLEREKIFEDGIGADAKELTVTRVIEISADDLGPNRVSIHFLAVKADCDWGKAEGDYYSNILLVVDYETGKVYDEFMIDPNWSGQWETKEDLINSTLRGTLVGEGYDGGTIFVDSETRTELSEKDIAKINEALQK